MTIAEVKSSSRTEVEITEPLNYYVIMHNDDTTPMDFVIDVLIEIFHHDNQTAIDLTMKIHEEGKAIVGMYNLEIAEQKVSDVSIVAKAHDHLLKTTVEPA
jgi:ATP-dependent Clp protease adaptor protein ClpS